MKQLWTKFHHQYTQSWKLYLMCQVKIWCRLILIGTITFYSHSTTCSHWHPKPMHFSTLAGSPEDHTYFSHRLSVPYASFRNPKQELAKLSPMQWKLCHFVSSLVLLWLSLDTLFFVTGGESWESYWVTAMVSVDITWHP